MTDNCGLQSSFYVYIKHAFAVFRPSQAKKFIKEPEQNVCWARRWLIKSAMETVLTVRLCLRVANCTSATEQSWEVNTVRSGSFVVNF